MSTTHNPRTAGTSPDPNRPVPPAHGEDPTGTATSADDWTPVDDWTPDDRPPSAAENNFTSFALFGFLVLFGVGCFILF